MEDNLTSADPLSYTTCRSRVDLGSLVSISCVHYPTPSCGAPDQKYWTDGQVSNLSSNYPPKENRSRCMTITITPRKRTLKNQSAKSNMRNKTKRINTEHSEHHQTLQQRNTGSEQLQELRIRSKI